MLSSALETREGLEREFTLLRSTRVMATLPKRLEAHDVPMTALRSGWRGFIRELKAVRVTTSLQAAYGVLGREYEVAVESGVNMSNQHVYVAANSDGVMAFYSAIANYLFKEGSSSLFEYGLMKAVHSSDTAHHFDELDEQRADDDYPSTSASESPRTDDYVTPEKGHGIPKDESMPVTPQPDTLQPILTPTYRKARSKNARRRTPARTDGLRGSVEEEEHILALKKDHYAWHCQACLGDRDVLAVTPPRSYVYLPLHRRTLIEAHHVEHLQTGGDLGARNLVVLCKYHHDMLGDAISRPMVLAALSKAVLVERHFPIDGSGETVSPTWGQLAKLECVVDGAPVSLFFTTEHSAAWKHGEA